MCQVFIAGPLMEGFPPPATGRTQWLRLENAASGPSFLLSSITSSGKTTAVSGQLHISVTKTWWVVSEDSASGHWTGRGQTVNWSILLVWSGNLAKPKVIANGEKCSFLQKSPLSKNPLLQPIITVLNLVSNLAAEMCFCWRKQQQK